MTQDESGLEAASTGVVAEPEPALTEAGRLSEAGQRRFFDYINAKWERKDCPFHGVTNWEVNSNIGQMPGYKKDGFANYTFPVIVMTCSICGFTVPINAIKAGIIPSDQPASAEATETSEETEG